MESIVKNIKSLEGQAREYVRTELESGGAISKQFAARLAGGELWEFDLPASLRPNHNDDLRVGGEFNGDGVELAWAQYANFLFDFVSAGNDRLLLFENQWSKIGDPSIQGEEAIVSVDETLYHYLPYGSTPISPKLVEENMTLASAYPRIIFAVDGVPLASLPKRSVLERSTLADIQTSISHVVIGAHDGESFVVWSRMARYIEKLRNRHVIQL